MDWTERRTRFRALIEGDRCVHPGSVFDAMSARIAEDLGFEIGMFAGSTASLAVLGAPDHIVLTLSEFGRLRICRAGNLAILVDADHGYGNALNVMRTVEELETAGVCAASIEDTELPQPGSVGTPRMLSIVKGASKMKAAVEARQDPKFVIAGRTSACTISDVDDCIARVKLMKRRCGYDLPGWREIQRADRSCRRRSECADDHRWRPGAGSRAIQQARCSHFAREQADRSRGAGGVRYFESAPGRRAAWRYQYYAKPD